MASPSSG
jgi:hypothetical protein